MLRTQTSRGGGRQRIPQLHSRDEDAAAAAASDGQNQITTQFNHRFGSTQILRNLVHVMCDRSGSIENI